MTLPAAEKPLTLSAVVQAAGAAQGQRARADAGRQNLFGLSREQLRAAFAQMGEKPFRADQVMQWIYRRGMAEFEGMTNLSKDLRERLAQHFEIRTPELVTEQISQDGTRKWVLRLDGGNAIETVYIPEEDRATLCISSQVGCAMDCSFCSTAQQGFNRNLSTAEIIAQVWFAARTLGGDFHGQQWKSESGEPGGRVISNVVFMGMGEPLANYSAVVDAIRILLDDFGFGLSKRRVTVSTSGLVPFIDRLRDDVDTALAVSLHAPTDALRDALVPINRKYPLAELLAACRRYTQGKDRKAHIVYEYVMLEGINDQPEHARALAKLLSGMAAKVNLIPFNPFPQTQYKRSRPEVIQAFAKILRDKRIITTTRKTRGDDIDAACGQLVGKVASRQKNRLRGIPVVVQ
ncbi:23S rRNA (adenine(2503)-C(2))-methyltransferase RlmN [Sinimarinibacterium sp. NLF-5-8]|uniref:23S rRNA (adenine(2503)-C(2))-methyltransferase RlmN n=1 Tax=Sinimarinibacterium sp. NLF-5-8 TaxID=2698684 RepID=UPI00137C0F72|nr:23S rRNA (adenine(2503)-C(2))-methyltransferase RlmN [Sinimarinibacterium sp. NLF-5-8]QHS09740.1 23S rRNA (adenine(2503)-C(2))-methyltransferase RlmN [Sinimarinibacterium sp. NLF-5-8]